MDIAIAMYKLNPNYYYHCPNGLYDNLIMLDNSLKPSLEELHIAYAAWLNNEGKANVKAELEQLAEASRLKYITGGSGKAMAYQQQQHEVRLWQLGQKDNLPIAKELSLKLNTPIENIIAMWQSNINSWLIIGAKIESNLMKAKLDLANLNVQSQVDLDNFISGIQWDK